MMTTKVVNIHKEQYDVYIGRAGKGLDGYFGNPIKLEKGEERGSTIEKYRDYFYDRLQTDSEFKKRILSLKGKSLGCFCAPNPCHGDVIKEYLDNYKFTLLVCGSRDIRDYNFVFDTLNFLLSKKEKWDVKIINGGQRSYDKHEDIYYGADFLSSQYATDCEIEYEEFKADWNLLGKSAGPIRNSLILKELPDACVAFFSKTSTNRGTTDMLNKAKKAGIPTRSYYI